MSLGAVVDDLSGQYPAYLAPSSMEGGNLTSPPDAAQLAMTAPGSPPVTPMPTSPDQMSQVPLQRPGPAYQPSNRVAAAGGGAGEGSWAPAGGLRDTWT
jgi:hypothetical protein